MAISLRRPPKAHNWVRNCDQSRHKVAKRLVRLALNPPRMNYLPGDDLVRQRLTLQTDVETLRKAAARLKGDDRRRLNTEYFEAFLAAEDKLGLAGLPAYDFAVTPFRIGPGLVAPVQPLAVLRRQDKLLPVMMVGWSTMPLTHTQKRLLMTVYEDALFSLTDFQSANGVFVSFPKNDNGVRTECVWERGDFRLMQDDELRHHAKVYIEGLLLAEAELAGIEPKSAEDEPSASEPVSLPLFPTL